MDKSNFALVSGLEFVELNKCGIAVIVVKLVFV